MTSRALRIENGSPGRSEPPPNRGRLLNAQQVAELIGNVSAVWVRRNVPHKLTLSHSTVRWFECDVLDWLERLREGAA